MSNPMTHEEITALLDRADALVRKGEYTQAEALANEVLASKPSRNDDEAHAICVLGTSCSGTARYDDALTHFNKALSVAETASNLSWQSSALIGIGQQL